MKFNDLYIAKSSAANTLWLETNLQLNDKFNDSINIAEPTVPSAYLEPSEKILI